MKFQQVQEITEVSKDTETTTFSTDFPVNFHLLI